MRNMQAGNTNIDAATVYEIGVLGTSIESNLNLDRSAVRVKVQTSCGCGHFCGRLLGLRTDFEYFEGRATSKASLCR